MPCLKVTFNSTSISPLSLSVHACVCLFVCASGTAGCYQRQTRVNRVSEGHSREAGPPGNSTGNPLQVHPSTPLPPHRLRPTGTCSAARGNGCWPLVLGPGGGWRCKNSDSPGQKQSRGGLVIEAPWLGLHYAGETGEGERQAQSERKPFFLNIRF